MSPRGPYMVGGHRVSGTTAPNRDSTLADLIGPRVIYAPNAPRSLTNVVAWAGDSKGEPEVEWVNLLFKQRWACVNGLV